MEPPDTPGRFSTAGLVVALMIVAVATDIALFAGSQALALGRMRAATT